MSEPERFGRRRVTRMSHHANRLRQMIRERGDPEMQAAWDAFDEGVIDFVFGKAAAMDKETLK